VNTLFLYDIDGTILSTQGAGRASLDAAFEQLHGVERAFAEVRFGGRTDPGIIDRAYALAGLGYTPEDAGRLQARYLELLNARLAGADITVHPGVHRAIEATAPLGRNALLTGNWEVGAQAKLGAVDLWHPFDFGAFGDDSPNRNDLVPVAVERSRASGFDPARVIVIGDTEADVACARAGGALAVAVLTGWADRGVLERARPDLLIDDLDAGLDALLALAI